MEQVLCIQSDRLPRTWLQSQTMIPMALDDFVDRCTQSGFSFIDRPTAEETPSQKQIIPYILLSTGDGQTIAVYQRKGSEKRLHDLWSAGIGGHINPLDSYRSQTFKDILLTGMKRELDEELVRRPAGDHVEFLGVISDDTSPVSCVHLGAVFKLTTCTPEAYVPGPELHQFQWISPGFRNKVTLELWSELALNLAQLS